jgi:hypothetical protein
MKAIIIGHGPSIKNARLGGLIDNFDGYIIRLTNRSWQNSLDYGTKVDYVCASSEFKRLHLVFEESKAKYETWIYAHKSKGLKELKKTVIGELKSSGFDPVICRKEVIPWLGRYKEIYGKYREETPRNKSRKFLKHFSQGLAAIIIAIQRLEIEELLLLGFDNLLLGTDEGFFSYACLAITDGKQFALLSLKENDLELEESITM